MSSVWREWSPATCDARNRRSLHHWLHFEKFDFYCRACGYVWYVGTLAAGDMSANMLTGRCSEQSVGWGVNVCVVCWLANTVGNCTCWNRPLRLKKGFQINANWNSDMQFITIKSIKCQSHPFLIEMLPSMSAGPLLGECSVNEVIMSLAQGFTQFEHLWKL